MLKRVLIFVVMVTCAAPLASGIGIPDLENSWAEMTGDDLGFRVMFNIPNGSGSAFTEARTLEGVADATITLYLRDANNDPIVNYPKEDMWIADPTGFPLEDGSWNVCPNGSIADANTDVNGETTWVNPLFAGGWNEGGTVVKISGEPLNADMPLFLNHNSPDLNGDLVVNLSDIGLFAGDYFSGYSFRSDFNYDGVLNLSDIALFAPGLGSACP